MRRAVLLLCQRQSVGFSVKQSQLVNVVPNAMSVDIQHLELEGMGKDGTQTLPFTRMLTQGMGTPRELSVVRGRDLMRPADSTTLLGLLENVHQMVREGAVIDESAEVPLETSRPAQRREVRKVGADGFDHLAGSARELPEEDDVKLWLTFFRHPQAADHYHCLLLPSSLRRLRHDFSTPLRPTNLLFKHLLWSALPPAVYRELTEAELPTAEQCEESYLHPRNQAGGAKLPLPGVSVTLQGGRCEVRLPRTSMAQRVLRLVKAEGAGVVTLLASRHEDGVDGFLCWDPQRDVPFRLDSFVIDTRAAGANVNEDTDAAARQRVGATFVTLWTVPRPSDELQRVEDGVVAEVTTAQLAELLGGGRLEGEAVRVEWASAHDVADPSDDAIEEDDRSASASASAAASPGDTAPTLEELEAQILGAGGAGGAEEEEEELPNWLEYIKQGVAERTEERQRERMQKMQRQAAMRSGGEGGAGVPELQHVSTEVRPMSDALKPPTPAAAAKQQQAPQAEQQQGEGKTAKTAGFKTVHTPTPPPQQSEPAAPPQAEQRAAAAPAAAATEAAERPEEERTVVEPRMTLADFGDFKNDKRAQSEAWEPYVIRVATVLSAVFAHCGRRLRPTRGKDEPGTVEVRLLPDGKGGVQLTAKVLDGCSMELVPEGLDILKDRLNRHCSSPPAALPLLLKFSL